MRNIRAALLALTMACTAGRTSESASQPVHVRAAKIDATVQTMQHDSATVVGLSAEGATIDAAYAGRSLRRVDVEFLGETGKSRETFYRDTTLFYVVRREYRYDAPLSGRIVDSTITKYDLTLASTPAATKDSLAKEMLALVARLPQR